MLNRLLFNFFLNDYGIYLFTASFQKKNAHI